jgi:hypothetical protein
MKFNAGYNRDLAPGWKFPEFMFITRLFYIDIDFTPLKQARKLSKWFPFGWCGAIGFPGAEPPWTYWFHYAWHAWSGEPDTIEVKIRDRSWSHEFRDQ